MKLYDINESIVNAVNVETGEALDPEALAELKMEEEEKIENIGCWIKNLKADADALKTEEKNLKFRREVVERKIKNLTTFLDDYMRFSDKSKVSTAKVVVSFRKSSRLNVTDELIFTRWLDNHDNWLKYSAPTLDKQGLTEFIKQGGVVEGAELTERRNIQIK